MPLWLRLVLLLVAVLVLAGATSWYVFRRGARLLRLGRRGRFALAAVLVAAPVALLVARLFEGALPPAVSFGLGAAGAAVLLGVWISTVLLGAVDLTFFAAALLRRAVGPGPGRRARPTSDRTSAGAALERGVSLGGSVDGGGERPSVASASTRRTDDPRAPGGAAAATAPGASSSAARRVPEDAPRPLPAAEPLARAGAASSPGASVEVRSDREGGPLGGPRRLGRRELVRQSATGAALGLGFGSAFYGTLFGRHDYDLHEVPVPIPGLSPRLDGYRIAQLSDVHFGVYVGLTELDHAVELVRRARADLVVLTGDLVDHDARYAPMLGRLVRRLSELPIRDGVAAVPGNHDYYAGVDAVLDAIATGGGRVLRNSGRVVGDAGGAFGLVGVDDLWARRNGFGREPDLDRALAMVPPDLPKVLLCHNPAFFPEARGRVALQLSGHTHGGQVNLGLRPAELLLPYVQGSYEERGSRLYVNRGFGTAGPPARVDTPPEVSVLVLTAA